MYKDPNEFHTGTSHEACNSISNVALDLHIVLGKYVTESVGTILCFASAGLYENYFFTFQILGLFFYHL